MRPASKELTVQVMLKPNCGLENTMLLNARSCGWPSACVRSLRCTSSNRASRFVSSSPRLSSPFSSAKVEGSAKAESSIASASIPAFS